MGPITHFKLSQKAVESSETSIAAIIRSCREWLDFRGYWRAGDYAAGVPGLPDIVLGDFLFQCLPRNIWVVRLLASEILNVMDSDQSKASFLTQLASHYLVDAPWIGHRLEGIFGEDKANARRLHDYIENKTDNDVEAMLEGKLSPVRSGYWHSFWETLFDADSRVAYLVENYKDKSVFAKLVADNVKRNLQTYVNFMNYLDMRKNISVTAEVCEHISNIFSRRGLTVYADRPDAFSGNARVIAFNMAMKEKQSIDCFLSGRIDESDIVLVHDDCSPSIRIEKGKLFLAAGEDEIGNLTDIFLDMADADFGTEKSKTSISEWPGNYFLSWSGRQIRDKILTEDFYGRFRKATENGRFRSEDELVDPEKALPTARAGIISYLKEKEDFLGSLSCSIL